MQLAEIIKTLLAALCARPRTTALTPALSRETELPKDVWALGFACLVCALNVFAEQKSGFLVTMGICLVVTES